MEAGSQKSVANAVDQSDLVVQLRKEADAVKDCAIRHLFQAMTFSAAGLAAIATIQGREGNSLVSLCCAPLIVLLHSVARTTVYKFDTANRNCAYELHLERTRYLSDSEKGWKSYMRGIGWEEAMRAWRVIQPTVFDTLHGHRKIAYPSKYLGDVFSRISRRLTKRFCRSLDRNGERNSEVYNWWEPDKQVVDGATYRAGTYLRDSIDILFVLMFLCMAPMILGCYQLFEVYRSKDIHFPLFFVLWFFVVGVLLLCLAIFLGGPRLIRVIPVIGSIFIAIHISQWFWGSRIILASRLASLAMITGICFFGIIWYWKVTSKKIRLQESGLLCMHSAAILWQAAVVAHYRALEAGDYADYRNYTKRLSEQAVSLRRQIDRIHDWIDGSGETDVRRTRRDSVVDVKIDHIVIQRKGPAPTKVIVKVTKVVDFSRDGSGVGLELEVPKKSRDRLKHGAKVEVALKENGRTSSHPGELVYCHAAEKTFYPAKLRVGISLESPISLQS